MRILGLGLILAAAALAAWDVVETMPAAPRLRALGEWWFRLDPDSLQLLQPAIERHISPALWDPWMLSLLEAPAALVLGAVGAACLLVSRLLRR